MYLILLTSATLVISTRSLAKSVKSFFFLVTSLSIRHIKKYVRPKLCMKERSVKATIKRLTQKQRLQKLHYNLSIIHVHNKSVLLEWFHFDLCTYVSLADRQNKIKTKVQWFKTLPPLLPFPFNLEVYSFLKSKFSFSNSYWFGYIWLRDINVANFIPLHLQTLETYYSFYTSENIHLVKQIIQPNCLVE